MKHLLSAAVLLLSLLSLGACQSKRALDTRMAEIAGDYRLQSISDSHGQYYSRLSNDEREAATPARVLKNGTSGTWIFEYTLPILGSDKNSFQFHRLVQEVTWDQSFGAYFFSVLSEEDLRPTGFEPEDITLEVRGNGVIVFHNFRNGFVSEWVRNRSAL